MRHITDLNHGQPVIVREEATEWGAAFDVIGGKRLFADHCVDWSDAWADVMDPGNERGEHVMACYDRHDGTFHLTGALVEDLTSVTFYDRAALKTLGLDVDRFEDMDSAALAVAAE